MLLDRRDDPINSRKGTFSSISFDNAALFLGSDVENRKLLTQQFAFVPFGRMVLASRLLAGFAFGKIRCRIDRFRAGAAPACAATVKKLGPRTHGLPRGGDRLLILKRNSASDYRWATAWHLRRREHLAKAKLERMKLGYGWVCASIRRWIVRGDVGIPPTQPPRAECPVLLRFRTPFLIRPTGNRPTGQQANRSSGRISGGRCIRRRCVPGGY